ncbi:MAG: DUF4249 family protein, partial [Melioribacteraceae bacterium]
TDFYNPNNYEKISDALVSISSSDGNSFILEETQPGIYTSENLTAFPNNEYSISVSYLENNYTAISKMPEGLILDSLTYEEGESRPFKDEVEYRFHCFFQDKPGVKEFARFKVYKNSKQINGIFLYEDKLTDGSYIDFFRFPIHDEKIKKGDSLTFELLSIDKNIFNYFTTLGDALAESSSGPFGSQSPGNPTSNWSNDAFGYFSAYTVSSKTIVIK